MNALHSRRPLALRLLGGALATAAVAWAMYALAAGTASSLGASFHTEGATRHAASVQFAADATRDTVARVAARARCDALSGDPRRRACNAAATGFRSVRGP